MSNPAVKVFSLSESTIAWLREQYRIPNQFRLFAFGPDSWVISPPPDQVAFYLEHLWAGLRFLSGAPLSWASIFNFEVCSKYFRLLSTLSNPACIEFHSIFYYICPSLSYDPTIPWVSLFWPFFILRPHPKAEGWWFFSSRKSLFFITGLLSSIHDWKTQFFFIFSSVPWGFSFIWKILNVSPNGNSWVDVADREDFLHLKDMKVPP